MKKLIKKISRGSTLVEYALILTLVVIVAVAALTTLGTTITSKFTAINAAL